MRFTASRENVENVVNPPHTPVFQNSDVFREIVGLAAIIPTTKPISIAPTIFVNNVNIGNSVLMGTRLIRYRPSAPKAPPNATKKIAFYSPSFVL
jgi:hypothetical protein